MATFFFFGNAAKKKVRAEEELFFWACFLDVVFGRLRANHQVKFSFFLFFPSPERPFSFGAEQSKDKIYEAFFLMVGCFVCDIFDAFFAGTVWGMLVALGMFVVCGFLCSSALADDSV